MTKNSYELSQILLALILEKTKSSRLLLVLYLSIFLDRKYRKVTAMEVYSRD